MIFWAIMMLALESERTSLACAEDSETPLVNNGGTDTVAPNGVGDQRDEEKTKRKGNHFVRVEKMMGQGQCLMRILEALVN